LITPFAAVKATPTRWDLLALSSSELIRRKAGLPQLLCVVPPLAGAISHGMFKAELGDRSSRPLGDRSSRPLRYTSPFQVLATNQRDVQIVEEPLLWFSDGTHTPPDLPTEEQLGAALQWWKQEKIINKGGGVSAALGAGSRAVWPSGKQRAAKGKRPARFDETESD
jgi:hypothetical protein